VVILQVATHDLFQDFAAGDIVGSHRSFPDRPPRFALEELVRRYLLPRLRDPGEILYHHDREDVARTMASLERIARLVRGAGAELFVLHVEQPAGYEPEDELTRYGKAALRSRVEELDVPFVPTAAAMAAEGGPRLFFDGLHPNPLGNRVLAREAAAAIAAWQARLDRTPPVNRKVAMR
jgi:lysophospholipase L1-like esterase